jgi:hypothetical protein
MAVPARAIARRKVADAFFAADAVRPDSAIRYETPRFIRQRAFERMKDQGVLKPGKNGGYYLDVPVWHAAYAQRKKRIVTLLGLAAVAGAVVSLL